MVRAVSTVTFATCGLDDQLPIIVTMPFTVFRVDNTGEGLEQHLTGFCFKHGVGMGWAKPGQPKTFRDGRARHYFGASSHSTGMGADRNTEYDMMPDRTGQIFLLQQGKYRRKAPMNA